MDTVFRSVIAVLALTLAFLLGIAFSRALDERPKSSGTETIVRTLTPVPQGSPGSTVTAQVRVKNTGVEPETYQLDPRTTTQTPYAGVSATNTSGMLPITFGDPVPQYIVPPFSSQLKVDASTT